MKRYRLVGKKLVPIPPDKKDKKKSGNLVLTKTLSRRGPSNKVCIVRSVGGIGDLLMSTPLARQLKENDPQTYVTFAVSSRYLGGVLPEILRGNPYVDDVIPHDKVKGHHFSRVMDVSVIKNIYEVPKADPLNKIDLYSNRCQLPLRNKVPIYVVSTAEKKWAEEHIKDKFKKKRYLIGVQLESKAIRRTWPHAKKLIKAMSKDDDFNIIAFTKDRKAKVGGKNVYVANHLGIRQASALIDQCDVLVACDSGLMHIGGALGKKMVCIFGPTHPLSRVNYYENASYLWKKESCHKCPCWYDKCPYGYICMKQITVDAVRNEVYTLIRSNPEDEKLKFFPAYSHKKTSIGWINESDMKMETKRKVWGAESSNKYVIDTGTKLGYQIDEITRLRFNKKLLFNSDLLIVNAISRFSPSQLSSILEAIYDRGVPCITYQHDYAFCPFRNQIKCNGERDIVGCRECEKRDSKISDSQIGFYRRLLEISKLNLFISYPHREIYKKVYGNSIEPSYVISPPVDPIFFKRNNFVPRDPRLVVCTAGRLQSWNKGWSNIKDYIRNHPEYNYELYTDVNPDILAFERRHKNVKVFRPISSIHLPDIYSRASKLLCLPSNIEPAGRTPIEAALCECGVVMNDNVGVKHFNYPLTNRDNLSEILQQGVFDTWKEIEKAIER